MGGGWSNFASDIVVATAYLKERLFGRLDTAVPGNIRMGGFRPERSQIPQAEARKLQAKVRTLQADPLPNAVASVFVQ
jgi:hypothetical protein